ncbi:oligosaccharide flippase family protein [uncultured Methanolobus sp.]|uniref:oligosaccharide flippase family protein n=1 Tax=uncultured Methanolobus sp. TaxID=218300 RepID=UPI002AABBA64|nr:oligosaccharide flippase family protein [uncultured Methanolobus sp.]
MSISSMLKKIHRILFSNYIAKAFSLYSASQAINALINFAILALYTNYLSPDDFGKLSLIWIFVVVMSIIIDGRLNTSFSIRYYKSTKEENTTNIYTIFLYNLLIFIIVYASFLSFPSSFETIMGFQVQSNELSIVFLLIIFMVYGKFYTNYLMIAKEPKKYFVTILFFNLILITTSIIYLEILQSGYISYLKSYLISYLIIAVIGFIFFFKEYTPKRSELFSYDKLKKLLYIGLPLIPDAILLMLLIWADRYIINVYQGLAIVGIYSVGYRFSEAINAFIISPFGQALSPHLFEQFSRSKEEYKKTMSLILKYYWMVIIGIIIAYFVVLKEVYQLIIEVEYMEGYNVIGIILLGITIGGAANLLGATMVVAEKTKRVFLFTSITVILNIGLNLILVPEYGMYGAAAATLLSYILQLALIYTYTQKILYVQYDRIFMIKTTILSLLFLLSVVSISYMKISVALSLGLKGSLFVLFLFTLYNIKEVNDLCKRF